MYPTSLWEPGENITDVFQVPIPPDLPSGHYSIVIGMYDFSTGLRLPIADGSVDHSFTLPTPFEQ
jgi:hypothetical protein